MDAETGEPLRLFEIKILDPDTRKTIHTVSHPVLAINKFRACELVRSDYGFPKRGGWILRAFPLQVH